MKIADVMTPCPYRVEAKASVMEALETMALRGIRHLPVVDGNDLVGVLTERDARLGEVLCSPSSPAPTVGELCSKDPYVVQGDEEVSHVTQEMCEKKFDCALVADDDGNFVGIFTSTDAFKLVYMLLGSTRGQ